MCTYQTEQISVEGSGKGATGWFALSEATVYFDHPVHAMAEHTLNIDFRNPGEVLTALNLAYQMESHGELFCTVWYGVYHRATGRLRYASAGHPWHWRMDRTVHCSSRDSGNGCISCN